MTLTVITPTIGRATLSDTARSVVGQLAPGDEWLIVGDGAQANAAVLASQWPGVRYLETAHTANWGNVQRELGLRQASGSHVLFVDDDDVLVDGALAIIRQAVAEQPNVVHLFRCLFQAHRAIRDRVLWEEPRVRNCNVGTGMVTVPRDGLQASWVWPDAAAYEADYSFINQAVGQFGVAWHPEIVQIINPYRMT